MPAIHRISITVLLAFGLCLPADGMASQTGGSIYYEDPAAVGQSLEFRAHVWRVPDDYYRVVAEYRPVGSRDWKGLDRNWCWTQRCALGEVVSQAKYISRDGYIWRFQNPTSAPEKATTYRFTESSYRDGTGACVARMMKRSS